MRVSNQNMYNQVNANVGKNRGEMAKLQEQASSMKRINKPSDDPTGTAKTLSVRTNQAGNDQYLKNIDHLKGFLNYTDAAMGELTDVLARAKELAMSQATEAGTSAVTRMSVATEIDQLLNQTVNIGNRRIGDRYIFAGFKTTESPFGKDGEYRGDSGEIKIEFAKGTFMPMNLPGDKAFLGVGENSIASIPDDRRGANTPNPTKVQPTPQHPPQLDLRGPASQEMVAEKAQGIRTQDAEAQLDTRRGENIFQLLDELKIGLRTNDTMIIQGTLERLDTALEQTVMLRSQVGTRVTSLDQMAASLQNKKVEDAATVSKIEDADAFETFSDITKNEGILKATLQTSTKMIQPSLLDFLR